MKTIDYNHSTFLFIYILLPILSGKLRMSIKVFGS